MTTDNDNVQSGKIANANGQNLEKYIANVLKSNSYIEIDRNMFTESTNCLKTPLYSQQFVVGQTIYGTVRKCDFIIFHPEKHRQCLVIEAKWQQAKGSVDEKFPYLLENIKIHPYNTIIVIDGGGCKPQSIKWLKTKISGKLIDVFNMMEFQKWANKGNL